MRGRKDERLPAAAQLRRTPYLRTSENNPTTHLEERRSQPVQMGQDYENRSLSRGGLSAFLCTLHHEAPVCT